MFPRLIGIGLLVCTGIYLWQTFRKPEKSEPSQEFVHAGTVIQLSAAILVYPVLLHYLNFILATSAVVYFMLLTLKYKGPVWDFIIALGLGGFQFRGFRHDPWGIAVFWACRGNILPPERLTHGNVAESGTRIFHSPGSDEHALRLGGLRRGHHYRGPSGFGSAWGHGHPSFLHPFHGCYRRHDPVCRDLLRRHVRRFHHLHSPQYSRGGSLGGHLHRRVQNGSEGKGRGRPDRRRRRVLHRRNHQHLWGSWSSPFSSPTSPSASARRNFSPSGYAALFSCPPEPGDRCFSPSS